MDQEGQENEIVIAHEVYHSVEDDSGVSNPVLPDITLDTPLNEIPIKSREAGNENRRIAEENAGHIENVVRGEVSVSRGVRIPLRKYVPYSTQNINTGLNGPIKKAKAIKKNYDYYKKSK